MHTPTFTAASLTLTNMWEQPVSIGGKRIKKMWYYIYNGIVFGHKKEGNSAIVTTGMNLEDIVLNETHQTEEDKYHTT